MNSDITPYRNASVLAAAPIVALCLFLLSSPVACAESAENKGDLTKVDKLAEPTTIGRVVGRIYDAATGTPMQKAIVCVEKDGQFPADKKDWSTTDELGTYKCEATIGRISSNIDIGRVLLSSPVALLFGSGQHKTKRVDVSRVNIRVTADGYKPFEGPVSARSQDAERFELLMEPVLLVPGGSSEISTSAVGWGTVKLVSLSLEPSVVESGAEVTATAVVKAVVKNARKDLKLACRSRLWNEEKGFKAAGEDANGLMKYQLKFKAPKEKQPRAEELVAVITQCQIEVSGTSKAACALLQIVPSAKDQTIPSRRQEAYDKLATGRTADAAGTFSGLVKDKDGTLFDKRACAWLAERQNDYSTATSLRKDIYLSAEDRDKWTALASLTSSLQKAENYAEIITVVEPELAKMKAGDQPKKLRASIMGNLGLSYVKTGQLEKAAKLNERVLAWPFSAEDDDVADFRFEMRMANAEAALTKAPQDANARAEVGRVLLDSGRWEEAAAKLQSALEIDPASPSIRADMDYAVQHLASTDKPVSKPTEEVIAAARLMTVMSDGKSVSRDFFTWHKLAMLLYARARAQQAEGDSAAQATIAECVAALREALKLGRSGAKRARENFSYQYGYLSGSQSSISGFIYPEADLDLVMLDCLKQISADNNRYLAHFNLASTLVDLNQAVLAKEPLDQALALKPDFAEARFLQALYYCRVGDDLRALPLLDELAKQNPKHPRVNLVRADLLQKQGDTAGAAACLAAHAAVYGQPAVEME
ncbi:MAG: tetratricopeptide repeat protein [Armatimonadota bacterium]